MPGMTTVAVGEAGVGVPAVPMGEPYRPIIHVDPWEADRVYRGLSGGASLRCALVGQGGELVGGLSGEGGRWYKSKFISGVFEGEERRPSRPRYSIRTADGELVVQGALEYG